MGLCVYVRHALDQPKRAWVVARLATQAMSPDSDVNRPIAADVRAGLADGRLACFSPETGIPFVVGVGLSLTWRVLQEGSEDKALVSTSQFVTLLLRAFGLPPLEAEMIAGQAVERVLRSRR